ncbi:DNA polymerase I [Persicimonas caeni]|uniref:DNA polymerase I n=1 Tax=Persicimonas caeni TaxID=2292766 RepID=A0A4Y6PTH1_PERCE|nr:DNA polymerase I [Persicimonas caeni]QDG51622.1 DNA polymerase I [Persicimonas caeni]QED32843.1 DNA polymerase I [Persicimonas caeni]
MPNSNTLYIVDGSSYIFRAFYAIRNPLTTSKGLPTNGIYGFTQMLIKLLRAEDPKYIAVTFDAHSAEKTNFRKEMYEEYKANRSKMPDDLKVQLPYFHKVVEAMRIPLKEQAGVEADDVIATMTKKAREEGLEVCIISADKDLMQLLSDHVSMLDTMRDKKYTPEDVQERFNVSPDKVRYVLALAGDSSDNIPGVPGIGEVTGGRLIDEFGDLETLLANIDKVGGKKRKQNLTEFADQARLSLDLVTLRDDCDVELDLDRLKLTPPDMDDLTALFSELEFETPLREVRQWMDEHDWLEEDQMAFDFSSIGPETHDHESSDKNYRAIFTEEELDEVLAALDDVDRFAFDLETTSLDPLDAKICGMSFAWNQGEAVYIPCAHAYDGAPTQLDIDTVLEKVRPYLEGDDKKVVGQHLKYEWLVLRKYGIDLTAIKYDTMLMSYLLDPGKNSHSLDTLARDLFNYNTITFEDVAGKGKNQVTFDQVDLEEATPYAAEDADLTLMICNELEPELIDAELDELHDKLEVPLTRVLGIMEATGVRIDHDMLGELSEEFEKELQELQDQIDELSGGPTNPNSPKQLREVLFDKLGLPVKKRTKTGPSTAASVLEELSELHELPELILEYRSFSKLKGTYVDALPELIREDTGRIHTDFNQAVTATGRLSSSNPNLQNIPMRTARGRQIRKAFVPDAGSKLLVADYSQIELRILAHMSQDPLLLEAYGSGADIHRLTASQIFDVEFDEVTPEQRGAGKTINFGVLYGMGSRRLARELDISQSDAKQYIDNYFEKYAKVTDFFDELVERARDTGYAETMFGRRRLLPELTQTSRRQQAFAERAAVNTPIQGTAADIIKYAMVNLQKQIEADELPMRMLLQVHDELVFEVEDDFVDEARDIVREGMEGVCEMDVPLEVDLGVGDNWLDAK